MGQLLKKNISSGIVVFFVALPLCLGIALAQNAPLLSGLVSGIVGGIIVGILGASHISVSGPAAGLTVVVVAAIAQLGGFQAFTLAVMLSGALQIAFGMIRAGLISKFIPGSVIKGMLAAIGIIIVLKQLPHLLGYDSDYVGDMEFLQPDGRNTFTELWVMLRNLNPTAIMISVVSFGVIIFWDKKISKKHAAFRNIPGSLIAVFVAVAANLLAAKVDWLRDLSANHLVQIPVDLGWQNFAAQIKGLDFSLLLKRKEIWTVALTIAVIGSIETLLSLEAADKLDPQRRLSNKNRELLAQGTGNIISGFFGGLPITAVIVRTVTNVNSGATHRFSAIWHGLLLAAAVFAFPKVLNMIPLAVLAAILALVGYKLSSHRIFLDVYNSGREQFIPFLVTVVAVVFTDILIGVAIGGVFAVVFVLINDHSKGFFVTRENANYVVELSEDINFIHRPGLSEALRKIPDGASVTLHAENQRMIHTDIAELISEFRESAALRDIKIIEKNMPYIPTVEDSSNRRSPSYKRLIHGNRNWVRKTLETDNDYFKKLARGQKPEILWIGCADSRVPPNEITETKPGEIFIHRNVANLVVHTDLNMLSVLQYAVEALGVKHVIVAGHYECGGIRAAMQDVDLGLANNWLRNIKEVYHMHAAELDATVDPKARERLLVELSTMEQVRNLAKTSIIQKAWKKRQLEIHGWVVDIGTGYIKELPIKLDEATDLEPIFRYKL